MATPSAAGPERLHALALHLRTTLRSRSGHTRGRRVEFFKGAWLIDHLVHSTSKEVAAESVKNAEDAAVVAQRLMKGCLVNGSYTMFFRPAQRQVKASGAKSGEVMFVNRPKFSVASDTVYVWTIDEPQTWNRVKLAVIVFAILGAVLHPIWPTWLRVAVWWLSVTVLVVLVGFFFIRTLLFCTLWLFGIDCWILPNLFEEVEEFGQLFRPVFHVGRSGPGQAWTRVLAWALVAAVAYWVHDKAAELEAYAGLPAQFVAGMYDGQFLSNPADAADSSRPPPAFQFDEEDDAGMEDLDAELDSILERDEAGDEGGSL